MDIITTGLNLTVCLMYLDDIIIFSTTGEQLLERFVLVLGHLKPVELKPKPENSTLLQKSVYFLGHILSDAGISAVPDKVRAIIEWPTPKNERSTSFVGFFMVV